MNEESAYQYLSTFQILERDNILGMLEENHIDFEIEVFDGTAQASRKGSFGQKVGFSVYVRKDCYEKARELLKDFLPRP